MVPKLSDGRARIVCHNDEILIVVTEDMPVVLLVDDSELELTVERCGDVGQSIRVRAAKRS